MSTPVQTHACLMWSMKVLECWSVVVATGLDAPQHVESPWIRDLTLVPRIS